MCLFIRSSLRSITTSFQIRKTNIVQYEVTKQIYQRYQYQVCNSGIVKFWFKRPFQNPAVEGWRGLQAELAIGLYPNETSTDFAYVPFGGGQRRCAGDMFAIMEATVALSVLMKRFDVELACEKEDVEMITGATIHTKAGMPVKLTPRR